MNEILVASSAFEAYFTISALFGLMRCKRLRWRLNGAYRRDNSSKARSSSAPTTMRSGLRKSRQRVALFQELGVADHLMRCLASGSMCGARARSCRPARCSSAPAPGRARRPWRPARPPSARASRSAEPSSAGGVPTATNTTSRPRMSRRQVGAEVEAVRPVALDQHRGEAGLEERHLARAQLAQLLLVHVDADDVRARVGEAGARDQTHVSGPNDCNFHECSPRSSSEQNEQKKRARTRAAGRCSGAVTAAVRARAEGRRLRARRRARRPGIAAARWRRTGETSRRDS